MQIKTFFVTGILVPLYFIHLFSKTLICVGLPVNGCGV